MKGLVARPTAILRSPSRWCLEAAPILQLDYLNRFLTYDDRLITTKQVAAYYLGFHVLHTSLVLILSRLIINNEVTNGGTNQYVLSR